MVNLYHNSFQSFHNFTFAHMPNHHDQSKYWETVDYNCLVKYEYTPNLNELEHWQCDMISLQFGAWNMFHRKWLQYMLQQVLIISNVQEHANTHYCINPIINPIPWSVRIPTLLWTVTVRIPCHNIYISTMLNVLIRSKGIFVVWVHCVVRKNFNCQNPFPKYSYFYHV